VVTFLVPAHPGSPGQRAVKRVCVCVCVCSVLNEECKPKVGLRPKLIWGPIYKISYDTVTTVLR